MLVRSLVRLTAGLNGGVRRVRAKRVAMWRLARDMTFVSASIGWKSLILG